MAGSAAGTRGPLWDTGGVCHHGDGAGPRADELQSAGSAHPGTQSQGLYHLQLNDTYTNAWFNVNSRVVILLF